MHTYLCKILSWKLVLKGNHIVYVSHKNPFNWQHTVYSIIFAYRYFCGFGLHVGAEIREGLIS